MPPGVREEFARGIGTRGRTLRNEWLASFKRYKKAFPALADQLEWTGEGQAIDVRRELLGERRAELRPRGGGEGAQGQAMVARIEGEQASPSGGEQRALPGDLDRVGAGDREVDARIVDRCDAAELAGEGDARRVRGDVAEAVQELRGLAGEGRFDTRVAVADGGGAEAGGEVDEAVAVDIEDVRTARRSPDEGRGVAGAQGVDAGRLEAGEVARQRDALRPRQGGADLRQQIAAREQH